MTKEEIETLKKIHKDISFEWGSFWVGMEEGDVMWEYAKAMNHSIRQLKRFIEKKEKENG